MEEFEKALERSSKYREVKTELTCLENVMEMTQERKEALAKDVNMDSAMRIVEQVHITAQLEVLEKQRSLLVERLSQCLTHK